MDFDQTKLSAADRKIWKKNMRAQTLIMQEANRVKRESKAAVQLLPPVNQNLNALIVGVNSQLVGGTPPASPMASPVASPHNAPQHYSPAAEMAGALDSPLDSLFYSPEPAALEMIDESYGFMDGYAAPDLDQLPDQIAVLPIVVQPVAAGAALGDDPWERVQGYERLALPTVTHEKSIRNVSRPPEGRNLRQLQERMRGGRQENTAYKKSNSSNFRNTREIGRIFPNETGERMGEGHFDEQYNIRNTIQPNPFVYARADDIRISDMLASARETFLRAKEGNIATDKTIEAVKESQSQLAAYEHSLNPAGLEMGSLTSLVNDMPVNVNRENARRERLVPINNDSYHSLRDELFGSPMDDPVFRQTRKDIEDQRKRHARENQQTAERNKRIKNVTELTNRILGSSAEE